jgi:hypothetical protein
MDKPEKVARIKGDPAAISEAIALFIISIVKCFT